MPIPVREQDNLVQLCLDAGLTHLEGRVMLVHYGDGFTVAATAERLGISVHAVQCHLSNAGRKIRRETERRELQEQAAERIRELRAAVEAACPSTPIFAGELTAEPMLA